MNNPAQAREAFDSFDKNKNGTIEAVELKEALAELGLVLSDEAIEEMINEADINKDGVVSFEEFYALLKHFKH